ncbi:MAG: SoxR-reducing system protein RseC [Arsenophonus endosymbiont of Ceratovacuna japonica]
MIKEWMKVISWHNGQAILKHYSDSGCNSCIINSTCAFFILNKIGVKTSYQFNIAITKSLITGQKIKFGIHENSLLLSSILVYLIPLFGFFIGGEVIQFFFLNQFIIFLGTIIGISFGFLLSQKIYKYLEKKNLYQLIILQIN